MIARGRTEREAIAAGTFYGIRQGTWDYEPPACETLAEVLACARERFGFLPGTRFEAYRIVDRVAAGTLTEPIGSVELGEDGEPSMLVLRCPACGCEHRHPTNITAVYWPRCFECFRAGVV